MRTINLIWEVRPRDLGKSWMSGEELTFFEVMPDGTKERVQIKVQQERVPNGN